MRTEDDGLVIAHRSAAGARPRNEDAFLAERLPDGRALLAVADGVGGLGSGHVASRTAVHTLRTRLTRGEALADAIRAANETIRGVAEEGSIGTTLVAAVADGVTVQLANVGDSRGYICTALGLDQVTMDHTVEAEARAAGVDPSRIGGSRWAGSLTRSLGTEREVEVDTFGPFPLGGGEYVILCSDGVHGTLDAPEIERIVGGCEDPAGLPGRLVERALALGSDDNVTAVILYRREGTASGGVRSPGRPDSLDLPWDPALLVARSRKVASTGRKASRWILALITLAASALAALALLR